jgi:hypothetical protein
MLSSLQYISASSSNRFSLECASRKGRRPTALYPPRMTLNSWSQSLDQTTAAEQKAPVAKIYRSKHEGRDVYGILVRATPILAARGRYRSQHGRSQDALARNSGRICVGAQIASGLWIPRKMRRPRFGSQGFAGRALVSLCRLDFPRIPRHRGASH